MGAPGLVKRDSGASATRPPIVVGVADGRLVLNFPAEMNNVSTSAEITTADRLQELIACSDSPLLADTALPVRELNPSVPGWLLASAGAVASIVTVIRYRLRRS